MQQPLAPLLRALDHPGRGADAAPRVHFAARKRVVHEVGNCTVRFHDAPKVFEAPHE